MKTKNLHLRLVHCFLFSFFYFLNSSAYATIKIVGPDNICNNNTAIYADSSQSSGGGYTWSVSSQGTIAGSANNQTVTIAWTTSGTAKVFLALDSAGTTLYDTLIVTVKRYPLPYITAIKIYGCQVLDTIQREDNQSWFNDDGECIRACAGSTITYTAHGFVGSTYTWIIDGGTIQNSTDSTRTIKWPDNPGLGNITLTESSNSGCKRTISLCIEIIEKPLARFRVLPIDGIACLNQDYIFTDASKGSNSSPIIHWLWDFGDGTFYSTSTFNSPTHAYTTPGKKVVKLIVKNACNCTDTAKMNVDVMSDPSIKIKCASVLCEGDTGYYAIEDSTFLGDTDWKISGGHIVSFTPNSVVVLWDMIDQSGFGYITANITSGSCPGPVTLKVPVIKSNIKFSDTALAICDTSSRIYRLPTWPGTTFNWSLDPQSTNATLTNTDQPNEIVLNTNGIGQVILRCDYNSALANCGGSASLRPVVMPYPTITGPTTACKNQSASYELTSGFSGSWHWQIRYPNGSIVNKDTNSTTMNTGALTNGSYAINIVTKDFCTPKTINLSVERLPQVADTIIGPRTVCRGVPYEYEAGNTTPGRIFKWSGNNVAYNNIADTATGKTVTASFLHGYPLQMTVVRVSTTAPYCQSLPTTITIQHENVNPTIIGDSIVCPDSHEQYSTPFTTAETYEWFIGDPTYGSVVSGNNSPNVTILWNHSTTTRTTYIKLRVRKCDTTVNTFFPITIRSLPALSLAMASTVCRDVALTATANTSPAVSAGNFVWNFGDGTTTTTTAPVNSATHSYKVMANDTANYTVMVTLLNPNGCTGTMVAATATVTVLPAPVVSISPSTPLIHCTTGFTDTLTATLQNGFEPTDSLRWTTPSGPGTACGVPTLTCSTFVATAFGYYTVTAVGNNGCAATSNALQIVQRCDTGTCILSPMPNINITDTIQCGVVQLTGNPAGGFDTYWSLPAGLQTIGMPTATTIQAVTQVAGVYTIEYGAHFINSSGDTCKQDKKHNVVVPLVMDHLNEVLCNDTTYTFTLHDHANYYPGTVIDSINVTVKTLAGSLITNQTVTGASASFNLPPGVYKVTETLYYHYNGTYSSCTTTDTVTLSPLPVAAFTFIKDNSCEGIPVFFSNQSTNFATSFWDFGDDAKNTLDSVQRVYSSVSSPYFPKLTVTNANGCKDSVTHTITIKKNELYENLNLLTPPYAICDGDSVNLQIYNSNPVNAFPNYYVWHNNLSHIDSGASPTKIVKSSGYYWATAFDAFGCYYATPPVTIVVNPLPDPGINGIYRKCDNKPFTLNGYEGDEYGYDWTRTHMGVTLGLGNQPFIEQVLPASDSPYVYQLTITSPVLGCSKTKKGVFYVAYPPPAPVISYGIECDQGYDISLQATCDSLGMYNWSNGMNGPNISDRMGGFYKVWFTDDDGCISTSEIDVPKRPLGYMWTFPTGCYTKCLPDTGILVSGPIEPFYHWQYTVADSIYIQGNQIVAPLILGPSGPYTFMLQNNYCADTVGTLDFTIPAACSENVDCGKFSITTRGQNTDTLCRTSFTLVLDNGSAFPVPYTLTSPALSGSFSPLSGVAASGSSNHYHTFTTTAAFTGDITFLLTFRTPSGSCMLPFTIEKFDCPGGRQAQRTNNYVVQDALLRIIPNPARGSTTISYHLNKEMTKPIKPVMEVYDMIGRKKHTQILAGATGSTLLSTQYWGRGVYNIVLHANGKVIKTGRLLVQ